MSMYVQVIEDDGDDPIELPLEHDGTLLLSTLVAQFTGACGLKYRNPETQVFRGVRLADGRLYLPEGNPSEYVYTTVYPKAFVKAGQFDGIEETVTRGEKRKGDMLENPVLKTKKLARRCSDLIVLGLPWKLTEEDLRIHFGQFGELVMVQIKRDPVTKQSKGFGFIRFVDYDSQVKAMNQRHNLDGRWCDLKIPNSKALFEEQEGATQELQQKIYVGRLTEDITADDLRSYFSQYGEVTEVYLPKPFRAFAFITFNDPDVALSLCGDDHIVKGISIHVGNATPKGLEGRGSESGWGKRFGAADGYGAVGQQQQGGRGRGFAQPMQPQNFNTFGNPNQISNAMMAAAQQAIYSFMTQAATTGQPGGYTGGNRAAGGYGNQAGSYGNAAGGYNAGGYTNRFTSGTNVGQPAAGAAVGGYAQPGQVVGATGGGYNGAGGYVSGMEMDPQAAAQTGTRWS